MKTLLHWMIVVTVLAGSAVVVLPDRPAYAAEGLLTGELVVMSPGRFRLVGHDGTFVAPAGTPLESLDGRPVQVEVGANRRVLQITEMPIRIDPVTHGKETVRGKLIVSDSSTRSFTLAGDTRSYVAPPNVDVAAYGGNWVEVHLDTDGRVTAVQLVSPPPAAAPPRAAAPPADVMCSYGGQAYSAGATVCQAGTQYRCENAAWRNIGVPCGAEPPPERICMFGGATVASGSTICREGTAFRCTDGAWVSLQTACR